jgi:restriction system protein
VAVPDFQTMMLPVLKVFSDRHERQPKDVRAPVAQSLNLSEADTGEMLPSGRQTRFANRIAWGLIYLKRAGLLATPRRGVYTITSLGQTVLANPPERIDINYLMRYPDFVEFRNTENSSGESDESAAEPSTAELTPDEQIRTGSDRLKRSLAALLLEKTRQVSPRFFENLVVELLVAMGYGGSHEDAASVVGQTGDGGIDGIIKEDRLGLESIYIQAKRWEGTVGRPVIQQFAGALQGQRARKGVLITTSSFSKDAIDYTRNLQSTIVLIDGRQLSELMIEFGIGVSDVETIRLKKLDEDYFADE